MKKISLLVFIALIAGCQPNEKKAAQDFISKDFIDPSSAQFRNETQKDGVLCGEVNSKNSFGAYTGFKRFVSGYYPPKLNTLADVPMNTRYGGIEGLGVKGDSTALEMTMKTSRIVLGMTIHNWGLQIQINKTRAKNGLQPLDFEKQDTILKKYQATLDSYEKQIRSDTSEAMLIKLVDEILDLVIFEELWAIKCT